jgi:hypothetical protein
MIDVESTEKNMEPMAERVSWMRYLFGFPGQDFGVSPSNQRVATILSKLVSQYKAVGIRDAAGIHAINEQYGIENNKETWNALFNSQTPQERLNKIRGASGIEENGVLGTLFLPACGLSPISYLLGPVEKQSDGTLDGLLDVIPFDASDYILDKQKQHHEELNIPWKSYKRVIGTERDDVYSELKEIADNNHGKKRTIVSLGFLYYHPDEVVVPILKELSEYGDVLVSDVVDKKGVSNAKLWLARKLWDPIYPRTEEQIEDLFAQGGWEVEKTEKNGEEHIPHLKDYAKDSGLVDLLKEALPEKYHKKVDKGFNGSGTLYFVTARS